MGDSEKKGEKNGATPNKKKCLCNDVCSFEDVHAFGDMMK